MLRIFVQPSRAVACAVAIIGLVVGRAATAEDARKADGHSSEQHIEFWSGAQAFDQSWSVYSGATLAPFGQITQDGFRLRAVAGYGAYTYSGLRPGNVLPLVQKFRGEATFADVLAGYQVQLGRVTLKAFGGAVTTDNRIEPNDPETTITGTGWGAKAAIETWWDITDHAWTSVDLAWATLHDAYSARARLGWRFAPAISAGLETSAVGNEEYNGASVGAFVRYEWARGELSLSGGFASDQPWDHPWANVSSSSAPYATVNWLMRF